MFNVIIFSKNRACQLDLLLRSIEQFFDNWHKQNLIIVYSFGYKDYQIAYDICKWEHKHFTFIDDQEMGFKEAVSRGLNPNNPYTVFFVDDNIMLRSFSDKDDRFVRYSKDPNILCLSLRMHPNVTECYTEGKATPPPAISSDGIWDWTSCGHNGDWSYPMSLDGNIFRTNIITPHVRNMSYSNPNTMEAVFAQHPIPVRNMICYQEPRLLNVPANKVQDVNNNRSGNVNPLELNEKYIKGKRINLKPFVGIYKSSPHYELPYDFM